MDSYQFFIIDIDEWEMRISGTHEPGAKRLTLIGPYPPQIPVVEPLTGCEFAALMEKLEAKGFEVMVTTEEKSLEPKEWKSSVGRPANLRGASTQD